jgi:hypothetical protein
MPMPIANQQHIRPQQQLGMHNQQLGQKQLPQGIQTYNNQGLFQAPSSGMNVDFSKPQQLSSGSSLQQQRDVEMIDTHNSVALNQLSLGSNSGNKGISLIAQQTYQNNQKIIPKVFNQQTAIVDIGNLKNNLRLIPLNIQNISSQQLSQKWTDRISTLEKSLSEGKVNEDNLNKWKKCINNVHKELFQMQKANVEQQSQYAKQISEQVQLYKSGVEKIPPLGLDDFKRIADHSKLCIQIQNSNGQIENEYGSSYKSQGVVILKHSGTTNQHGVTHYTGPEGMKVQNATGEHSCAVDVIAEQLNILDDNYPDLLTTTILARLSIYIISFFCSPFLFNCITYNI